jgi:hypothetical protein
MKKCLILAALLLMCAAARAEGGGTVLYTQPVNIPQSAECRVFIEGVELKMIDVTVNNQRTWASNPILLDTAPVGIFDMGAPVSVEVRFPGVDITDAVVRPLSLGITPYCSGDTVRFVLTNPCAVTVEYNGNSKGAAHLFANPPETNVPSKDDPDVIYFGPGVHEAGIISPKEGQTVYLAGGCMLRGAIQAGDVSHVTVRGRGIIDGSLYDRWDDTVVPLNFVNSSRISIEGITVIEPSAWMLQLYKCAHVTVNNVHLIGWCSNSDGITVQSCEDVAVSDSFVRSWDDSLVVKGYDGDCRGISFNNMTLWTDLAQSCEIGYETRADLMENITFENITILHGFHKPALSIHNSDNALVRNVVFRNITVEDARMGQGDGTNFLIDLTTTKSQWSKSASRGSIRGVLFENISVLAGNETSIRIFSFSKECNIDDITFRGLNILGRQITSFDQLRMNINSRNGRNIILEGTAPAVRATYPGYLHTYPKAEEDIPAEQSLTATANGQTQNYGAANAVDGRLGTYWEGAGCPGDMLTVTLPAPVKASLVRIFLDSSSAWGARTQAFTVEISMDGVNFISAVPLAEYLFDPHTGNSVTIPLSDGPVAAVRLVFASNTGAAGAQAAEVTVE